MLHDISSRGNMLQGNLFSQFKFKKVKGDFKFEIRKDGSSPEPVYDFAIVLFH